MGLVGTEAAMKEGVESPDLEEMNRNVYILNQRSGKLMLYGPWKGGENGNLQNLSLTLYGTEAGMTAFDPAFDIQYEVLAVSDKYISSQTKQEIVAELQRLDSEEPDDRIRTDPIIIEGGYKWVGVKTQKNKDGSTLVVDLMLPEEIEKARKSYVKKLFGRDLEGDMGD
jgi:hypothetical protein